MDDKQSLRFQLRKRRKAFEIDHLFWPETDASFPAPLLREIDAAHIVAGYVKAGSEVDPAGLMDIAGRAGKVLALPWLADRKAEIRFRQWTPSEPLETAPFGFQQPAETALQCAPDLILTPLVGFDRALNRLGQGQGHYDRAFAAYPHSLRIGLAWSVQECDNLVPDPWDIPLDAILTEKEWITSPRSRITGS